MESGPRRVNAPLEGPVIPRSRRNLFKDQSFGSRTQVKRCMQRKRRDREVERTGGCSVGERENGERLWVSALCLSEKTRGGGELSINGHVFLRLGEVTKIEPLRQCLLRFGWVLGQIFQSEKKSRYIGQFSPV